MSNQAVFKPPFPESVEEIKAETNAAHWPASSTMPAAYNYEAFLQSKVEIARESVRAGDGLANDDVEAAFAARRRRAKTS